MKNLSKSILMTFFLLVQVALSKNLLAYDLDVYCDDNVDGDQCDVVGTPTLFDEKNLYPGSTIVQTIRIINGDHNDNCHLSMFLVNPVQTPSNFSTYLNTAVTSGDVALYGALDEVGAATPTRNLQNMFEGSVSLGEVEKGGASAEYEWVVSLSESADNALANSQILFDYNMSFSCDHPGSDHQNEPDENSNEEGAPLQTPITPLLSLISNIISGNQDNQNQTPPENPQNQVAGDNANNNQGGKNERDGQLPETKGAQTESSCTTSNLWWALILVQAIILAIILYYGSPKKFGLPRLSLIFLVQVIVGFILYKFSCPWWDVLVSLMLSAIFSYFSKKSR